MNHFRHLMLLLAASFLLFACEKEEDKYNPDIENTDELILEYSRLTTLLNKNSSIIDTCTVPDVFKTAASAFAGSYRNIDILLEDAQEKINAEIDSSGNKTRLEKLISSMNASRLRWYKEQEQIEEIKNIGIKPFLYFNKLYSHIKSYKYTTSVVNKVIEDYNVLNSNIEKLRLISRVTERSDYEYIINYGAQIRALKKVHTFARITSQAYIMKFSTHLILAEKDSMLIAYQSLDATKDNKELYNLYIKPHFSFSITGERFGYNTLTMFALNSQRIVVILDAFNALRAAYSTFTNNFETFATEKPQLKSYASAIETYNNRTEIIDSLYPEHSDIFNPMVYFGNNTDSILLWKTEFLSINTQAEPIYTKYELKDTVDNSGDAAAILLLDHRLQKLYNQFTIHENEYMFFFAEYLSEIVSTDNKEGIGGKISALVEKTR